MTMQGSGTNSLIDPLGRKIDYVRLSVTDKCNLRCFYCLPKGHRDFGNREEYLTFDEIERVIRAFAALGVRRVRITGGEPLVRKNLAGLARRLSVLPGIEDLSLSTNAVLLTSQAEALHAAGIERLNVSLDTLRPDRFLDITGNDAFDRVLDGLMAARQAGFSPIKINMLALKGRNDDEVIEMAEFCIEHGFSLRFIETMPMGTAGRAATHHYMPLSDVKAQLETKFDLVPSVMPGGGPARYFRLDGSDSNIGFITPMSRHFCDTCNRVRLSVDGTLHLCLGQTHSVPLRPLLRAGIDDVELKNALIGALKLKPARHEFEEKPEQVIRFMSSTGG
jgi:cyclic pyranopterin phosphate synthase